MSQIWEQINSYIFVHNGLETRRYPTFPVIRKLLIKNMGRERLMRGLSAGEVSGILINLSPGPLGLYFPRGD
jgi:hypothetical protein